MNYCCNVLKNAIEKKRVIKSPKDSPETYGWSNEKGHGKYFIEFCIDYVYERFDHVDIKYCPFCGKKLMP